MTYIDIADICRSSPAVGTWAPGSGSTFFFLVGAHLLVLLSIEKHRVCVCVPVGTSGPHWCRACHRAGMPGSA
ncbi:hypothetical protein [Mycobacterium leprae]|uniref:hypothetical protein n=1 Tax=Mycobacterium leprae TaxID=1769 RepID=UPI0034D30701